MLNIQVSTIEAQETLTRMQVQIRDVGHEIIPRTLTEWQVEDMHRHYPNTDTPDYVSAETSIWPRSRTYDKTHPLHRAYVKRVGRPLSPRPRLISSKAGGTHRPILRPALFEKLKDRMDQMLNVNLGWVPSTMKGAQPTRSTGLHRALGYRPSIT